ncbi:MAG: type II secretion system minor pseudopilin GspI [Pseudomonadota bacterium]
MAKRFRKSRGFTLIEVMIALMIVGFGVVAVIDATNKYTDAQAEIEKRVLATWVASNIMAQARFDARTERLKQGSRNDRVDMGGYRWRIRIKNDETEIERVYKVTVSVTADGDKQKQVLAELVSAITENR